MLSIIVCIPPEDVQAPLNGIWTTFGGSWNQIVVGLHFFQDGSPSSKFIADKAPSGMLFLQHSFLNIRTWIKVIVVNYGIDSTVSCWCVNFSARFRP